MRLRYRATCVIAAVLCVALTVMRFALTAGGATSRGAYAAVLCGVALTVLVLFLLCGFRRRALVSVGGAFSRVTAFCMAWVGVALLIYAFGSGILQGEYPYPQPITATALNRILAVLLFAGAVLGGVFCLFTAVRWLLVHRTERGGLGLPALCPVVWTWARLLWYITSFASAVNRYRSITETALLLFEMLFLMTLARYTSGVEEARPRCAVPIALCTAVLGAVACFTRLGAYLTQNAALYAGTRLLAAPDFAIAALAAVFACQQMFGKALPSEEEPEDEDDGDKYEPAPSFTEETEAEFLLDADALASVGDEEDDSAEGALPAEERRPLELEDIINEILNRNS